jgi:hypothetical protein
MTLPAILPEFILMRIFMAIGAIRKGHSPEFLELFSVYCLRFMAFLAIHCLVLPFKLKPGGRVIEL